MPPPYETAKEAVTGLIEAYRTLDIEEILRTKDFYIDARLFWENLGPPIPEEKLIESRVAFEKNFRTEMEKEIPDYRGVSFQLVLQEEPQDKWSIVTLEETTGDNQRFELKLPVFHTDNGWKVVLHPGYDHL